MFLVAQRHPQFVSRFPCSSRIVEDAACGLEAMQAEVDDFFHFVVLRRNVKSEKQRRCFFSKKSGCNCCFFWVVFSHIQNQNRKFREAAKELLQAEEQVGRMWVNSNSFGGFCKILRERAFSPKYSEFFCHPTHFERKGKGSQHRWS